MTNLALDYESLTDLQLAKRIAQRDSIAVRLVTRRNNQRLFRIAWSVLRNHADAEEAVQDAYLKAFTSIETFAGSSSLSTWLTRIVLNEALGKKRLIERRQRLMQQESVAMIYAYREKMMEPSVTAFSPEADTARAEIASLLEKAISKLPENFRIVFMLRDVEGMSVDHTAELLQIPPQTVKTRLFRARKQLQTTLAPTLHDALQGAFPFAGKDCDRLTEKVLARFVGRNDDV